VKRAAIGLAVLALAACGGGSGRLSRVELVKRATAICTDQANKVTQIPRGPANATNAAGYLGAVLSVVEDGVKQYHRLKPPEQEQVAYDAFLRELDQNVDILRTLRAAAAARQRRAYVTGLADLHRSRLRINRQERRLGLGSCAGAG
jgi:hypothetical protein